MLRIKTQTKRKIAGFVAFLLAAILILSSVPVLFVHGAECAFPKDNQTEVYTGGNYK